MRGKIALIAQLGIILIVGLGNKCTGGEQAIDSTRSHYVRGPQHEKVVIFIHGLFGGGDASWRNTQSDAWWPQLLTTDPAFDDYDVYVINYGTPLLVRSMTIHEIAVSVFHRLRDADFFKRYTQIYFITHSMGGLVAKDILSNLNRPNPVELDRLTRVKAVLFISTPAQGASLAEIGSWISLNPQLKDMRPADLNSFLQSLEDRWQDLLHDRDTRHASFPKSFCAYETKPTLGTLVVSRVYAATSCDDTPHPLELNHIESAKPADTSADPYPWSKRRILETDSQTEIVGSATLLSWILTPEENERLRLFDGYIKDGRYYQALETIESLVTRYPNEHYLLYRYGSTLSRTGRKAEAVQQLEQAKRIKPDHMPTRMNLAWAYFSVTRYQEAQAELEWITPKYAQHSNARFLLAYIAFKERRYEDAKTYYRQIIQANGDGVADAMLYLAEILLIENQSIENKQEAIGLITQALARIDAETDQSARERLVRKIWCDTANNRGPLNTLRGHAEFDALLNRYNATTIGACIPSMP